MIRLFRQFGPVSSKFQTIAEWSGPQSRWRNCSNGCFSSYYGRNFLFHFDQRWITLLEGFRSGRNLFGFGRFERSLGSTLRLGGVWRRLWCFGVRLLSGERCPAWLVVLHLVLVIRFFGSPGWLAISFGFFATVLPEACWEAPEPQAAPDRDHPREGLDQENLLLAPQHRPYYWPDDSLDSTTAH